VVVVWTYDNAAMGLPADLPVGSSSAAFPMVFVPFNTGQGGADAYQPYYAEGDINSAPLPTVLYVSWEQGETTYTLDYKRNGSNWVFSKISGAYATHPESTWRSDFITGVFLVGTVVLTAGVGAGMFAEIGASVIGAEAAAAYPALAEGIGQVAVSTALNGGDVERAVKGTVIGLAGGVAGAEVAGAVDSAAAGSAAAAATRAALAGGDIKGAALQSLAVSGIKGGSAMLGDYFDDQTPINYAPAPSPTDYPDFASDITAPADVSYAFGGDIMTGFNPSGMDAITPSLAIGYHDPVYDAPAAVDDGWSGAGISSAIDVLTKAAIAAIQVNKAWQQSQAPVRVNSQPGSGAPIGTQAGTVITRNPVTGQQTVSRPSAGTPYVLADGRAMVNNGDGTYSLISANGATQTLRYEAGTGSDTPWLLYGALGLGALMLARR
jgi:hypothetical protein